MKIILLFLCFSLISFAKYNQQRVAVIDTGLDINEAKYKNKLCKNDHWDFVENKFISHDLVGHGTAITNLIIQYAKKSDYCLLIYRYYDANFTWHGSNLEREILAIKQAIKDGATIVNLSGGGDLKSDSECDLIKAAQNVTFVLAAGNGNRDIDKVPYYPASCGSLNIIAVGALFNNNKILSSNFGNTVKAWEQGFRVKVVLPYNTTGYETGTSISTAIHTGKLVLQRDKSCGNIK